jgi:hypothetical protein
VANLLYAERRRVAAAARGGPAGEEAVACGVGRPVWTRLGDEEDGEDKTDAHRRSQTLSGLCDGPRSGLGLRFGAREAQRLSVNSTSGPP